MMKHRGQCRPPWQLIPVNQCCPYADCMASTFGTLFRVTTFGESHGGGVGVVVDGCPPRLALDAADIQADLDRRRPGQSRLVTQRDESDTAEVLSGTFGGYTTGTPIAILVRNKDARPEAYEHLRDVYRPSHADFTYDAKYGFRDWTGGGRASARETVGRVAAAAIARKLLDAAAGVEVLGWVQSVHDIEAATDPTAVTRADVEAGPTRCPDPEAAARMVEAIETARRDGDSLGGVVECVCRGVPSKAGRAGVRQARGSPGRRPAVAPGGQGLRNRERLQRHPSHRPVSQRPVQARPLRRDPHQCPTAPAVCRAAFPTERTS